MKQELNADGYPKVRNLKFKDRKKLSGLIKKFAEKSGNSQLMEMIPGVPKQGASEEAEAQEAETAAEKIYELMKSVMGSLFEWIEEDVTAWFMEITNIQTLEEWDAMPFDIEVYILEELYKQKGFNNFFVKVLGLYSKIRD